MRVPLAVVLAPPVILLGSVAVFALLHAWSETPRHDVFALPISERPDRLEIELGDPDLTIANSSASAALTSVREASAQVSSDEIREVRVRWNIDASDLTEEERSGLRCAIVSAEHGTVLRSATPEIAAEGLVAEGRPGDELWAVVYHEDESPRRQYRQRNLLDPAEVSDDGFVVGCELHTMSVVLSSPESADRRGRRQVALSVTREDDPRWGLAPAHGDVLEFDADGMTEAYQLRALGPGRYRICADGLVCKTIEWPGDHPIVVELPAR